MAQRTTQHDARRFMIVHSALDHFRRGQRVSADDLGIAYGAPLDDAQLGRLLDLWAIAPLDEVG
jgi:hypothetical protein